MKRIHTWIPGLVGTALFGAVVIACSGESRVISSEPENDASLPPPSTPADAGPDAPAPPPIPKPAFDPADETVTCSKQPCAVELVAGDQHFCARMNDGTVRCWGANGSGVLGRAASENEAPSVVEVDGLTAVQQLSSSGTTACALATGGTVHCWGKNTDGLLGQITDTGDPVSDGDAHPTPAPVALPGPAVRVDIGPRVGCAILATGETWCWGYNGAAQLGRPTTQTLGAPALTPLAGLEAVRTAHGAYTSFAVTEAGDIVSWGTVGGPRGNLSARMASMELDPNPLPIGLADVSKLVVTTSTEYQPPGFPQPPLQVYQHACAVSGGEVYCWGNSEYAALGTGTPDRALKPTRTDIDSGLAWAQQVAVGGETTCIRLTNGKVHCAGDNRLGTLAIGEDAGAKFSMAFRPATEVPGYTVAIAATRSAVCALAKTGEVACWGANDVGQLGQGTKDDDAHGTPVSVKF